MEKSFKFVNIDDYVKQLIASGKEENQIFDAEKKDTARVTARRGINGEWIVTYTQDGTEEVKKQVGIDPKTGKEDMVVTNAQQNGAPILNAAGQPNTWTIRDSVFVATYEADPRNEGVFKPIQQPRKFIQISENIEFDAPASWGPDAGTMKISAGGFIRVDQADGHKYGIAFEEFTQTHNTKDPTVEERLHAVREECIAKDNQFFESELADDILSDDPSIKLSKDDATGRNDVILSTDDKDER